MDYTYTLTIEGENIITFTTLSQGIEYFMITIQSIKANSVILYNDQNDRAILAYTPSSNLGVIYASPALKEA